MQFAVWNLMDPGFDGTTLIYTSSRANVNSEAILGIITTMTPPPSFDNLDYKIFWPTDPKTNQPFVGVPEPSLIVLLGLGLGAVGLIWGRFKS